MAGVNESPPDAAAAREMPSLTLSVHSPSPFDSTRSLLPTAGEAATGRRADGRLRTPTAARWGRRRDRRREEAGRGGGGQTAAPARVVEKLCFGFWTSLVSRGGRLNESSDRRADYARTLWSPALRAAFPHRAWLPRRQAQSALERLRNQIAHHEPIFERHLWGDHQHILTVTGWISPEARAWIERRSRVPGLLRTGIRTSAADLH